jgi:hypothetical protein
VPLGAALLFSAGVIDAAIVDPMFSAMHFAVMFLVAGALMLVIAPGRRGVLIALVTMGIVAIAGAVFISIIVATFDVIGAVSASVIGLLVPYLVTDKLEDARREAAALQNELARRATSDDITAFRTWSCVTATASDG